MPTIIEPEPVTSRGDGNYSLSFQSFSSPTAVAEPLKESETESSHQNLVSDAEAPSSPSLDLSYHSYESDDGSNTPSDDSASERNAFQFHLSEIEDVQSKGLSHLGDHLQDSHDPTGQEFIEEAGDLIETGSSDSSLSRRVENSTQLDIARDAIRGSGIGTISTPDGYQRANTDDVTDGGDWGAYGAHGAIREARSQRSLVSFQAHTTESLQTQLLAACCSVAGSDKRFIPMDIIANVVSEKCVREVLGNCLPHSEEVIAEYARKICERTEISPNEPSKSSKRRMRCFRKIFIILVLCNKTSEIVRFLEKKVNDSDLPLKRASRPGQPKLFDLCRHREPDQPLRCFSKWTDVEIFHFAQWQWITLSPFFTTGQSHRDVDHYRFHHDVILPFTLKDKTRVYSGGSARVYRVDIHPKHHDFHETKTPSGSFALKRLKSSNRVSFEKEVDMLKKFSHNKNEHLISLLVTFEQNREFYLVFPWAEANLATYWRKENPNPSFDRETVIWVATQCKGIASGILELHKYKSSGRNASQEIVTVFGHHGDIKPENILWFPEAGERQPAAQGILKVSDFGLAEFSMHHTVSFTPKSHFSGSPSYRAPEIDLEGPTAIGRQYDIWTLGCLYLQFTCWLVGGRALLNEFAEKRKVPDPNFLQIPNDTFFQLTYDDPTRVGAIIKPSVSNFIERLHRDPLCSQFVHDFLDMISEDMLIVKKNDVRERDRICAEQLNCRFACMLHNCHDMPGYATDPIPKS